MGIKSVREQKTHGIVSSIKHYESSFIYIKGFLKGFSSFVIPSCSFGPHREHKKVTFERRGRVVASNKLWRFARVRLPFIVELLVNVEGHETILPEREIIHCRKEK
jgi:hypothetical protein